MYAHDKTYLPAGGWWTDERRLGYIREDFKDAVLQEPLPNSTGERILAEALKPSPWRMDLWAVSEYETQEAAEAEAYAAAEDEEDVQWEREHMHLEEEEEERLEREMEERAQWFGHTEEVAREMMSSGINPWDVDAYVSAQTQFFSSLSHAECV